ncbi:hypothetical protein PUNSTDRAFT_61629, partial [Punctularia strigosozonata HHB-11173 SS5]|uniref:uncharacterized protein n=1 Tax=Punctularia strigosozonata (strain HHB-11173) TaxID=741275 RepID=UPI0004417B87
GDDGLTLDERWRDHWVPRPVWKNLHTNSPTSITELPGVPYAAGAPWAPSQRSVSAHVRAFAALHHLSADDDPAVVSYGTRVQRLAKAPGGGWTLTLKRLTLLEESQRIKATWWQEDFDAVVVSLGLDSDGPHVPDIPGLVEWSKVKAPGEPERFSVYHSRVYRTPERYANKEYDWSKLHAFQRRSFRRFPASTEWVSEIRSFEPLASHDDGIQSGEITLINGTVLSGIDEVRISPVKL